MADYRTGKVAVCEENKVPTSQNSPLIPEFMEISQNRNKSEETESNNESYDNICKFRKWKMRMKGYKCDVEAPENKTRSGSTKSAYAKEKYLRKHFNSFGKSVSAQLNFLPFQQAIATQEKIKAILEDEVRKALKMAY